MYIFGVRIKVRIRVGRLKEEDAGEVDEKNRYGHVRASLVKFKSKINMLIGFRGCILINKKILIGVTNV